MRACACCASCACVHCVASALFCLYCEVICELSLHWLGWVLRPARRGAATGTLLEGKERPNSGSVICPSHPLPTSFPSPHQVPNGSRRSRAEGAGLSSEPGLQGWSGCCLSSPWHHVGSVSVQAREIKKKKKKNEVWVTQRPVPRPVTLFIATYSISLVYRSRERAAHVSLMIFGGFGRGKGKYVVRTASSTVLRVPT